MGRDQTEKLESAVGEASQSKETEGPEERKELVVLEELKGTSVAGVQ